MNCQIIQWVMTELIMYLKLRLKTNTECIIIGHRLHILKNIGRQRTLHKLQRFYKGSLALTIQGRSASSQHWIVCKLILTLKHRYFHIPASVPAVEYLSAFVLNFIKNIFNLQQYVQADATSQSHEALFVGGNRI